MANTSHDAADYINPLLINGMEGRLLYAPALKSSKHEMLLIYGHHALLERWWGLVENLREYGNVTMPDMPGFGGMDSFYKIGRKATIDEYADYLAAFVKMRYSRKKVTLIGISFGFVVVTRMLQRYPELTKRVNLVVSIVGFMHRDDFLFTVRQRKDYRIGTRIMGSIPVAWMIRYLGLNSFVIRNIYVKLPAGKRRFLDMDPTTFDTMMDFEVQLWQRNDVRTHWRTTSEFLDIDNCKTRVELPSYHVASRGDHYFDNDMVEQHMQVVFSAYRKGVMNAKAHTPSVIATKQEMNVMVPPTLKRTLRELNKLQK